MLHKNSNPGSNPLAGSSSDGANPIERENTEAQLRGVLKSNIKALRKLRGLSQQQLAEAAGLSIAYIGGIEIGIKSPALQSLCHIANALGVEVYQLLLPERQGNDMLRAFSQEVGRELPVLLEKLLRHW